MGIRQVVLNLVTYKTANFYLLVKVTYKTANFTVGIRQVVLDFTYDFANYLPVLDFYGCRS